MRNINRLGLGLEILINCTSSKSWLEPIKPNTSFQQMMEKKLNRTLVLKHCHLDNTSY